MCACRVTIFVVATEDAGKGCQIAQVKGPAPEVITYEKKVSCLHESCAYWEGVFKIVCEVHSLPMWC